MKRIFLARKRTLAAAAAVVLIAGGIGVAYYVDHNLPYWHFRTVETGKFYRTSQLDGKQFREAIDDYGQHVELRLKEGADPQAVLEAGVGRIAIRRFEITTPTLHNIFIQQVG